MFKGWDFQCCCPRCKAFKDGYSHLGRAWAQSEVLFKSRNSCVPRAWILHPALIWGIFPTSDFCQRSFQDDTRRFSCHGLRSPPRDPGEPGNGAIEMEETVKAVSIKECGCQPKNRATPKWMVKIRETPIF